MTAAQYFTNFIIDQTSAHTFPALLTRHGRWQRRYYCFKSRPSRPECLGWSAFIFQTSCLGGERETSRGEPWISWPTSEERGCCRCSPPARYLFHPWSRHNFSPFSHSGASQHPETRHENLIRWESLNKQTALSRQWQGAGHWSASHDTESDDKMGRDNGKLTRAGITPDLARSITAGLNFRQALNQFREWNWKSLHQN